MKTKDRSCKIGEKTGRFLGRNDPGFAKKAAFFVLFER
jgi:hypothetical protein